MRSVGSSETRSVREAGRWRIAVESRWRALNEQDGLPLHIFRLGGALANGLHFL